MEIKKHLDLLGLKVEDKVTGVSGIVTSVSFDLYGCIQAVVRPSADKDGKVPDCGWYDVRRLKVIGNKPVMDVPNFEYGYQAEGKKGPEAKPIP